MLVVARGNAQVGDGGVAPGGGSGDEPAAGGIGGLSRGQAYFACDSTNQGTYIGVRHTLCI